MSAIRASSLGRGFPEPVFDSQQSFRALLAAMSEPGTLQRLTAAIEPPAGLSQAATNVLLTLADQDTPIWFAPSVDGTGAGYVRFHCGAPITVSPEDARLAVIDGATPDACLSAFDAGDDRYPDRSATVIVQCAQLTGGPAVSLSGPGIRGLRNISPSGLRAGFWEEIAANNARYPMGVDLVLVAGADIMALPRSTAALEQERR